MEKRERFQKAYNYLKYKGLIHIQKDLAQMLKTSNTNISSALNGSEVVLTDNFLRRFAQAFKGTFNTDWLLYGDGDMLVSLMAFSALTHTHARTSPRTGHGTRGRP